MKPVIGSSPLARGLHEADSVALHGAIGSSPLARGLLVTEPWFLDPARIIPARAGFTAPGFI